MALLAVINMEFSLKSFNCHGNKLTAEVSTLGGLGHEIHIRSHKTNRIVTFVATKTEKDDEGDIICWNYVNSKDMDQPIRKVTIYND